MIRTLIVVTTYYFAKCMMMHDKTGGNRNSPVRLNMLKNCDYSFNYISRRVFQIKLPDEQ